MTALPARVSHRGDPAIRQEMHKLTRRVARQEDGALEELHRLSKAHPESFAVEVGMDMFRMVISSMVWHELPKNEPASEKLRIDWEARIRLMALELAPNGSSEARRLCALAVAFAWADHMTVSMNAAANGLQKEGQPIAARRRNGAHRRLMSALKTFAQITAAEKPKRRMTVTATPSPTPKQDESIFAGLAGMGGIAEMFKQIGKST